MALTPTLSTIGTGEAPTAPETYCDKSTPPFTDVLRGLPPNSPMMTPSSSPRHFRISFVVSNRALGLSLATEIPLTAYLQQALRGEHDPRSPSVAKNSQNETFGHSLVTPAKSATLLDT